MTYFWILAAALLAAVLALLLRPLLRGGDAGTPSVDARASNVGILRDQLAELDAELAASAIGVDQHRAAREELERRVLQEASVGDDRQHTQRAGGSAVALALALPVLAVALYAALGNPDGLDPILSQPAHEADAQDVDVLVERLAQRMKEQPGDPDGWALLGRAYASMQRFEPARDALGEALKLRPDDAQLRADFADMLAMTQERSLQGEPERQIGLALQADPDNLKALALAGSAAMQRRDFALAIQHWTRARKIAEDGTPFASGLDEGLREARALAGLPPAPADAAAPKAATKAAVAARVIDGQVRLAPALAARVQAGDTLFVFARAVDGPRAPLAVQRGQVGAWPVPFTLDDSMAMSPQLTLSSFGDVVVVARVSRGGSATPQPGDLEGQSKPLGRGAGPVEIVIDRVVP